MRRALAYSLALMSAPSFTPDEFRQAQHQLGLSDKQLAAMLGIAYADHVRRMKVAEGKSSHRNVTPTVARLLQAYLDGYRPADWPA